MTKINIVFDDVFDDVDIIAIPDEIVPEIEMIRQAFLQWIPVAEDSEYRTVVNGREFLVCETEGFIKWLNIYYCAKLDKAYVVARNTNYCPQYKVVAF